MSVVFLLVSFCLSFSCHGIEEDNYLASKFQNIDEFDCINIHKQPAFDNILLKNHKIQMKPSFLTKLKRNEEQKLNKDFNSNSKGCSPGMVPIMRTKNINHTYLRSLSKSHLGSLHPLTEKDPSSHFAVLRRTFEEKVNGTKASIEIFNPGVYPHQISLAQIWVENGPPNQINSIQIGWAVNPQLYGDNRSRVTAYWTADSSQKTGCYNMLCPGFMQVHREIYLGMPFSNVSSYRGPFHFTTLGVKKDGATGNWWLIYDNDTMVGYYPKEIIAQLSGGAGFLQFGGYAHSSPNGVSPPMGNGRFPNNVLFIFNSFFIRVEVLDRDGAFVDVSTRKMSRFVDSSQCYEVESLGNQYGQMRQSLWYGGPGGRCD